MDNDAEFMCAIVNPATGEEVEFLSETAELLVMENRWTHPAHRTVEHVHPGMQERWEVLEGVVAFRIGGEETRCAPGDAVLAPPGVPHLAWNAGGGPVLMRIEMRPALRWREFVERLFANGGAPEPGMFAEFGREIALP